MSRMRKNPPGVDPSLLIKDAAKLMPAPTRRLFLRGGASLGALAFLTGCDIVDSVSAEQVLTKISYFNDRAQALLFDPNRLAANLSRQRHHPPVPIQRLLPRGRRARGRQRRLQARVGGMVDSKKSWTLDELYALPQETQITRHICVEGLERDRQNGRVCGSPSSCAVVGADTRAK